MTPIRLIDLVSALLNQAPMPVRFDFGCYPSHICCYRGDTGGLNIGWDYEAKQVTTTDWLAEELTALLLEENPKLLVGRKGSEHQYGPFSPVWAEKDENFNVGLAIVGTAFHQNNLILQTWLCDCTLPITTDAKNRFDAKSKWQPGGAGGLGNLDGALHLKE